MEKRQGWVLEALRRTAGFLDANPELLATVNKSSARRNLDAIATQLAAHGVAQDGNRRASIGETARQRRLRAVLRFNHMRPIAVVAKRMLQGVPEFEALKLPKARLTTEPLVAVARGMAEVAGRHADVLIENGLPDDFLEQLLAAAMVLEHSVDDRSGFRGVRVGSTAGLAAEERRGRTILNVLDCLVRPMLGDNESLLAQWKTTRKVERARASVAYTPAATSIVLLPASAESSHAARPAAPPIPMEVAS